MSVHLMAYLLMTSLFAFSVARPPSDVAGTGNKYHVTSTTRLQLNQISHPTTADNEAVVSLDGPRVNGKLQTGSGNRKQKRSKVNDADWSAGAESVQ